MPGAGRNAAHTGVVANGVRSSQTTANRNWFARLAVTFLVLIGGALAFRTIMDAGGAAEPARARVTALAPDPTGAPSHSRYTFDAPGDVQRQLPAAPAAGGTAPSGRPPPAGGTYVPRGQPGSPLPPLATSSVAPPAAPTTTLYLSGADQLQPDIGTAASTDQTIGPQLGGACTPGIVGRWTAPPAGDAPLHGPFTGMLHVAVPAPTTLQISFTTSVLGGACQVLASTTATAAGSGPVSFTLPRVDVDLPEGINVSLVVGSNTPATVVSSYASPSYVVVPMPES
jgi:hypothetical protein